MSASRLADMRDPRLKTPLLLLLLVLTSLTGTVSGQDEEEEITEVEVETPEEPETEVDGDDTTPVPDPNLVLDPSPSGDTSGELGNEEGDKQGSGDEEKRSRSFDSDGEMLPTSTIYPDGVTGSPEGEEDQDLSLIIILIPVVLVVLVIAMIVCGIFVNRRWNQKVRSQELAKEDLYLDGTSTEKVPMPMFEEDVPSVLELEMEELDQWMKKDSETADDSKNP